MTSESRKLHEVFAIKKGRKPELHAVKKPGDVPYLVAKVMRGAQEPEWVRRDDPNAVHVTEDEAIIICDGSNSGEVFSGFSGALSSTMAKIEPRAPIDQTYLRRFLESNAELFAGTKTGAAIPHLDQDAMFNLEIPLPPLPEQQRIVRLLDEAFEGIAIAKANAEKNLQNAHSLFENYRGAVLDQGKNKWHVEQLGELCDIRNGSTPSKANPAYWAEGTIPWFTIVDMREQGWEITHTIASITALALNETSVKLLPEDAVLLCCTASVGEVAIARIPLTTNQQFNGLVVKDKQKMDPNFLFHFATTLQPRLLSLSGKTTIDFIPISRLREVTVPIPPLADQRKIVANLNHLKAATSQLTGIYEEKLASLVALKQTLLMHAFSGDGRTT
jgi:hypothetical protein